MIIRKSLFHGLLHVSRIKVLFAGILIIPSTLFVAGVLQLSSELVALALALPFDWVVSSVIEGLPLETRWQVALTIALAPVLLALGVLLLALPQIAG